MENTYSFTFPDAADILSPRIDFVFKLLFGSEENKDILSAFLKSVLDIPPEDYGEITLQNPILPKHRKGDKYGILDIRLKTRSGKHINIEMQVLDTPNYDSRILFYLSKMIGQQLGRGQDYGELNKTISISVLNFELIRDSINYKNVYRLYDKDSGSSFTDLLEVVTLELPKIPENAEDDPVLPWLKFIGLESKEQAMTVVDQYPQLKEAYDQLQVLSLDEKNRDEYEQRLKWYMDELNLLRARDKAEEKGFQKGYDRGVEQGISQGISQGIEQGLSQGLSRGIKQKALETAHKLREMGLTVDQIIEATGLSEKEIGHINKNG